MSSSAKTNEGDWVTVQGYQQCEIHSITGQVRSTRTNRIYKLAGPCVRLRSIQGRKQVCVNVEHLFEKTFIAGEDRLFYKGVQELKSLYPKLSTQLEDVWTLAPSDRKSLMIYNHPELVDQWSEDNIISLGTVARFTHQMAIWKCNVTTNCGLYKQRVTSKVSGSGCPTCSKIKSLATTFETMDTAKTTEQQVCAMFETAGVRANNIGGKSNCMFDITVQHEDLIVRGVQVKKIGSPKGPYKTSGMHTERSCGPYPDKTLILGINDEHGILYGSICRGD